MMLNCFKKREIGYTPWAPKKAPLLIDALNNAYIKLSVAILLAVLTFLIGAILGLSVSDNFQFEISSKNSTKPSIAKKTATVKAIKPTAAAVPAPAIKTTSPIELEMVTTTQVAAATGMIVPAIPMPMDKVLTQSPLTQSVEDILKNEYQLTTYHSTLMVRSAKEASDKTGVNQNLLLAMAAKFRKFEMYDGNKYIGVMNISPILHPAEVKKLKTENIDYLTVEGSFRLGAEVMVTYAKENNGDIGLALNKFIGIEKLDNKEISDEIIKIMKHLDGAV